MVIQECQLSLKWLEKTLKYSAVQMINNWNYFNLVFGLAKFVSKARKREQWSAAGKSHKTQKEVSIFAPPVPSSQS